MRKIIISLWLAMCAILGCGTEGRVFAQHAFMPQNDLWKQDNMFLTSMTQDTFNDVINQVEKIYKPIVARFGGNLVFERNWADPTVNAYADRSGNTWKVAMFGGLARRPEITRLGFTMVVCHELYHHLGGYPIYPGEWAADEGNSDYLGVHACMKKVLANTTENVQTLSSVAVAKCKRYYSGQALRVCYNVMSGAKSCADLLGVLNSGSKPSFGRTDTSNVRTTSHEHPAAQCRLDTMSNAAVCKATYNYGVIPNKNNYLQYSCIGAEDKRPGCWFAN